MHLPTQGGFFAIFSGLILPQRRGAAGMRVETLRFDPCQGLLNLANNAIEFLSHSS